MAEGSSEPLARYLKGEISVFEWLEEGENTNFPELNPDDIAKKCTTEILENLLKDDDYDDEDINEDDDGDDNMEETANDDEAQSINNDNNASADLDQNKPTSSVNLQDQESTTNQAPKMTELLLDLPAAKQVKKHGGTGVDQFLAEIPMKHKRKPRRSANTLPNKFKRQMGEANLLCVKGEYEKAKNICMDIIKQVPKCFEPFQTIGMVCELQNQMEKARQFFLIAAYLSKSKDLEEWLKLASMSLLQDDFQQALACYNQALKIEPDNIGVLLDIAALHYQMKDHKKAIERYESILKLLKDNPEKYFEVSIEMALIYHEGSSLEKAIEVMEVPFKTHPDHQDFRAINLLAELYMTAKQYSLALKIILNMCKFTQESQESSEEPLSSFSNMLGYDVQSSPQKTKAPSTSIPMLSSNSKWVIPDEVPIDIRVKAAVCLINLHNLFPLKTLMSPLFNERIEEVGDLYLDIAEAYADTGEHIEALPILDTLVSSPKYNQAAVWLKKAQCLMSLGRLEEAIMSYNQVVTLAPNHLEARLTLSSLHQQLGQPDQALDVISEQTDQQGLFIPLQSRASSSDEASEPMDVDKPQEKLTPQDFRLMFHKCVLLESQNRVEDFVNAGLQLFSMYFRDVYFNKPDEEEKYLGLKLRKKSAPKKLKKDKDNEIDKVQRRRTLRARKKDDGTKTVKDPTKYAPRTKKKKAVGDETGGPSSRSEEDTDIRTEEWWDMLKKVTIQASALKRHHDAEHLILCGLNSFRLQNCKQYQQELEFMSVLASCLNKRYRLAFDYVRHVMPLHFTSQAMWNILSAIVCKTEDLRHHRYCMRLTQKYPNNINLIIMSGHNAFMAGSYKFALADYMSAFRLDPNDPILSLLIGIQYIHLACQRFPRGRHMMVVQSILFLFQYLALRGECQEAYYNIGRAFHQLALYHFAAHYYMKALECPFHSGSTDMYENIKFSEKHDLHREAAFNLSLIYRASGNFPLAREILHQYVTI